MCIRDRVERVLPCEVSDPLVLLLQQPVEVRAGRLLADRIAERLLRVERLGDVGHPGGSPPDVPAWSYRSAHRSFLLRLDRAREVPVIETKPGSEDDLHGVSGGVPERDRR